MARNNLFVFGLTVALLIQGKKANPCNSQEFWKCLNGETKATFNRDETSIAIDLFGLGTILAADFPPSIRHVEIADYSKKVEVSSISGLNLETIKMKNLTNLVLKSLCNLVEDNTQLESIWIENSSVDEFSQWQHCLKTNRNLNVDIVNSEIKTVVDRRSSDDLNIDLNAFSKFNMTKSEVLGSRYLRFENYDKQNLFLTSVKLECDDKTRNCARLSEANLSDKVFYFPLQDPNNLGKDQKSSGAGYRNQGVFFVVLLALPTFIFP